MKLEAINNDIWIREYITQTYSHHSQISEDTLHYPIQSHQEKEAREPTKRTPQNPISTLSEPSTPQQLSTKYP